MGYIVMEFIQGDQLDRVPSQNHPTIFQNLANSLFAISTAISPDYPGPQIKEYSEVINSLKREPENHWTQLVKSTHGSMSARDFTSLNEVSNLNSQIASSAIWVCVSGTLLYGMISYISWTVNSLVSIRDSLKCTRCFSLARKKTVALRKVFQVHLTWSTER